MILWPQGEGQLFIALEQLSLWETLPLTQGKLTHLENFPKVLPAAPERKKMEATVCGLWARELRQKGLTQ